MPGVKVGLPLVTPLVDEPLLWERDEIAVGDIIEFCECKKYQEEIK